MLCMMLQAPWILYMVTMATNRVTSNRFSLDTFPVGRELGLVVSALSKHGIYWSPVCCDVIIWVLTDIRNTCKICT